MTPDERKAKNEANIQRFNEAVERWNALDGNLPDNVTPGFLYTLASSFLQVILTHRDQDRM